MTPRMSVRARAREVYGALADRLAPSASGAALSNAALDSSPDGERPLVIGGRDEAAHIPDASALRASASGGGEKTTKGGEESGRPSLAQPDLTARVRELYEKSAVPVREIARIAGVTERMIYRYVKKGSWKQRYACAARDAAVAAANRGRRWRVSPGRQVLDGRADVAPAKGAGGRFIRREDIGKPFATGLKALDPAGRARALVACRRAKSLSRAAQAKAAQEARDKAMTRALASNAKILADLRMHRQSYVKGHVPSPLQLRAEGLLIGNVEWSLRLLESLVAEREAARRPRRRAAQPVPPKVSPKSPFRKAAKSGLEAPTPPALPSRPPALPNPGYDPDDFRAWI